jgi:hypothetical protein
MHLREWGARGWSWCAACHLEISAGVPGELPVRGSVVDGLDDEVVVLAEAVRLGAMSGSV